MICELIYTSASKTLDGSGYGVVAKSANMPARLEKFLRTLSRYDFSLSAQATAKSSSPTVHSHTIFRDGDTSWHALSRIGPAGMDHSQRAVYLAHHVALSDNEIDLLSLTDLMREPSMFRSHWDGQESIIRTRKLSVPGQKRLTEEDRGSGSSVHSWTQAWLDLHERRKGQAIFLIVPPQVEALLIFGGALGRLPRPAVHGVTFITHLNSDRSEVQFDWIGIMAGSELARSIAHRHPNRTLDLSTPVPGTSGPLPRGEKVSSTGAPKPVAARPPERTPPIRPPGDAARDEQAYEAIRIALERLPREAQAPAAVTESITDQQTSSVPPPSVESHLRANVVPIATGALLAVLIFGGLRLAWWIAPPGRGRPPQPTSAKKTVAGIGDANKAPAAGSENAHPGHVASSDRGSPKSPLQSIDSPVRKKPALAYEQLVLRYPGEKRETRELDANSGGWPTCGKADWSPSQSPFMRWARDCNYPVVG